jgi:hypothetical protein
MIPHHKKKALVGVPVGLLLFGGSLFLSIQELIPVWLRVVMLLGGIGIYIWGCLALAEAKGYSTAIVLTVILGVLFPVVVLLALPDKHKHYRR